MKNLPEKIYLNLNMTPQEVVETKDKVFHEATKTWEITWSEECLSKHDPEYVLKDAFIEKAKKWLYLQLNEINMEGEDMENFLKDFKKYMEGWYGKKR